MRLNEASVFFVCLIENICQRDHSPQLVIVRSTHPDTIGTETMVGGIHHEETEHVRLQHHR